MAKDRDVLKKILRKNNQRVTRAVAEELVDAIAADGAYSPDEKDYLQARRDNEDLWFSRGTEKFLGRLLSNLPLQFHREAESKRAQDEKLAKLNTAIIDIIGADGEIGTEQTDAIFALIEKDGYTESYRFTVQFIYDGDRITDEAKKSLKSKIAANRVLGVHKAWVEKKAVKAIADLFDGSFQDKAVDKATADKVLDILFADFQYSEQEKETMANLYRNADMSDDIKNYIQDEISNYTNGMTLDGKIVAAFDSAIKFTEIGGQQFLEDGLVEADEVAAIIDLAGIGKGMSQNEKRTVDYCMQTFNLTPEAEALLDDAIAGDSEAKAKKVEEKVKAITAAAEKSETVKSDETAVEITPSVTLMDAYNELKTKKGQITARQADDFVAAIFKDGKYTKHEQATMRLLREEGVFTAAANREILLELRRFIAAKNFAKK